MYHRFIKIYELLSFNQVLVCSLFIYGSMGCYDAMRSEIFDNPQASVLPMQGGILMITEGGTVMENEEGGMYSSGEEQTEGGVMGETMGGETMGGEIMGGEIMGGEISGGDDLLGGEINENQNDSIIHLDSPLSPTFPSLSS